MRRRRPDRREQCRRTISAAMDEHPQWRGWFAHQLALLDLEYDPHHWVVLTQIRG